MKTMSFTSDNITGIREMRKTQTRRPVKPQPPECWRDVSPDKLGGGAWQWGSPANDSRHVVAPPYVVGDLVRVTTPDREVVQPAITIEIMGVRCERLCAISEADAVAEGLWRVPLRSDPINALWTGFGLDLHDDHVGAFRQLWTTIYGPEHEFAWASNPWVYVYECLTRVIDAVSDDQTQPVLDQPATPATAIEPLKSLAESVQGFARDVIVECVTAMSDVAIVSDEYEATCQNALSYVKSLAQAYKIAIEKPVSQPTPRDIAELFSPNCKLSLAEVQEAGVAITTNGANWHRLQALSGSVYEQGRRVYLPHWLNQLLFETAKQASLNAQADMRRALGIKDLP